MTRVLAEALCYSYSELRTFFSLLQDRILSARGLAITTLRPRKASRQLPKLDDMSDITTAKAIAARLLVRCDNWGCRNAACWGTWRPRATIISKLICVRCQLTNWYVVRSRPKQFGGSSCSHDVAQCDPSTCQCKYTVVTQSRKT